jgi:hypothetical protein
MKYAQLFTDAGLVMRDSKGNNETFAYVGKVADNEAIAALQSEVNQRGTVSAGALSLMVSIFDHPRMDGYKGAVKMGDRIPKELKAAMREQEEATLKPLFYAYMNAKNPADAKAAETDAKHPYIGSRAIQWDLFIGALREGGVYGNVKSYSMQYFAYFGMLPCVYTEGNPDKARLLSVSAMAKLIANAKTDLVKPEDAGIAGELEMLRLKLEGRNDKTVTGSPATAIHALREMLKFFEEQAETSAEKATEALTGGKAPDVAKMADAAVRQAKQTRTKGSKNKPQEKAIVQEPAPF